MKEPTKQLETDRPTLFGAVCCPRTAHDCQISLHCATSKCRIDYIRQRSLYRKQRLLGTRSNPAAGETEHHYTLFCTAALEDSTGALANDEPQNTSSETIVPMKLPNSSRINLGTTISNSFCYSSIRLYTTCKSAVCVWGGNPTAKPLKLKP